MSRSQEEGRWHSEVPGERESQKPAGVPSWNGNRCEEGGIGNSATFISKNVLGKSPKLSENLDAEGAVTKPDSYPKSFTCPVPLVLNPTGANSRLSFCSHSVPCPGDTVMDEVVESPFHLSQGV